MGRSDKNDLAYERQRLEVEQFAQIATLGLGRDNRIERTIGDGLLKRIAARCDLHLGDQPAHAVADEYHPAQCFIGALC